MFTPFFKTLWITINKLLFQIKCIIYYVCGLCFKNKPKKNSKIIIGNILHLIYLLYFVVLIKKIKTPTFKNQFMHCGLWFFLGVCFLE